MRDAVGSVLHASKQPDALTTSKFDFERTSGRHAGGTKLGSERKYTVTKEVCIAGVDPAKRPKYQLIAGVLYLIDFRLRRVSRRTELFARSGRTGGAPCEDAEQEYDDVLDAILAGIHANYGHDEVNHVLDMVQLRRGGDDSLLQAVLREKIERLAKRGEKRKELALIASRKRRNDPRLSPRTLAEQERKQADRAEAAINALKKFLAARQGATLTTGEADEFQTLLERTKARLGSRAQDIAEDFVLRARLQAESRAAGKDGIQEKLSFVKIEYFLYALTDADRLMNEVHKLRAVIFEL